MAPVVSVSMGPVVGLPQTERPLMPPSYTAPLQALCLAFMMKQEAVL